MKELEFKLELKGQPAPRPRFTRQGHCYTPKDYAEYKAAIAAQVKREYVQAPMNDAVTVDLEFGLTAGNILGKRSGDVDNLAKGVLDACNGILWADDSQVVKLTTAKTKTAAPYIKIRAVSV